MEAPLLNIDEVEVIVPGIDYVPEWGETAAMTVGYRGLRWTIYHLSFEGRVGIVNEGTTWAEPVDAEWDPPTQFPAIHITSASSISRAFVPKELLPHIEALLKLHA